MRLTNVAQMELPQGELHSLRLRMDEGRGEDLPVSFDQRRHVEAGERPGSWMAIAFRVRGADRDALAAAWMQVVRRHGALNTVFDRTGSGRLVLERRPVTGAVWRRHPVPEGTRSRDALRRILDADCTPLSRPSHLLALLVPDDGEDDPRPVAVIGSDHAHVDMWSLLILARDLLSASEGMLDAEPAASFAEHSALLEQAPPAPAEITARWHRILDDGAGAMPRFPLDLGDLDELKDEVVVVRDVMDAAEFADFEERAAEHGVRPTALALSVLTALTRSMADAPLRAVFPVHSRNEPRWHDSTGWFITNSVIECIDDDPVSCASAVRDALTLGSHPLAPILAPYGGMPEAPGMFAISWLDTRRLPAVQDDLSIQYVSAVTRTDGVMIWFIVNGSGMHLRCRYPDTPQARASVGAWLDGVVLGMRAPAGAAAQSSGQPV